MTQAVEESGGAVFLKGKVYLPGGYINVSTPTLYGHMQTYDVASDKWTAETERIPAAPPRGGWGDAAVCSDGTKVYVVNGGNGTLIYSALQIYDPGAPAGQRWTISPHAPSLDGTHFFISQQSGCAWIGGKMYLFGGLGAVQPAGTSTIQKLTWAYNPATHTWTDTGKKLRVGTWFFGYTSSSTTAFFAGGTTKIATGVPNKEAESFSPAGGWKSVPSLPVPASSTVPGLLAPSLGMLGKNLEVFGGGGYDGSRFVLQVATLTCANATCSHWVNDSKNLNTARWFAASAYGGSASTLYVAGGGKAPSGATNTSEHTR